MVKLIICTKCLSICACIHTEPVFTGGNSLSEKEVKTYCCECTAYLTKTLCKSVEAAKRGQLTTDYQDGCPFCPSPT